MKGRAIRQKSEDDRDDGRDPLQALIESAEEKYGWMKKYLDRSVTELEIRHAALDQGRSRTAPSSTSARTAAHRRGPEDAELLEALKAEIREEEKLRVTDYTTPTISGTSHR
jgi:predicted DNA-binding transcriptional regulator YafY